MTIHPIEPVFDKDSRVLILGSFPSVKSRETGFFYGHPMNRFWTVIARVFNETVPNTVKEKKEMLIRDRIALWDVICSCDIEGSSDSSIRNVKPNDLSVILSVADIKAIYVNGRTAFRYYRKYIQPMTGREAACLPSTSPANAAWSVERLTEEWKVIRLWSDLQLPDEMTAYCGVDCSSCSDYLGGKCPGCRKTEWKEDDICMPVECCRRKGIQFCGQCSEFPCREMEEFYNESNSHRTAYEKMKKV